MSKTAAPKQAKIESKRVPVTKLSIASMKSTKIQKIQPPPALNPLLPVQIAPPPEPKSVHEIKPYSRELVRDIFHSFIKHPDETRIRAMITPVMATQVMRTNERNRKYRESHMKTLAEAMERGEFIENGDAIRFGLDGRLLDGQHRLEAAIFKQMSFPADVVFDLSPESQLTMDGGLKRTVGDALAMRGEKYSNSIPAMMRWLFWLADDQKNYRITASEMIKLLDRYPTLRESVRKSQSGCEWIGRHTAIVATIHFIATNCMDKGDRADAFIRVWNTGLPDYTNDPARRVREGIRNLKLKGKQHTPQKLCDIIVQSFNYFVDKKAPRMLIDPKDAIKLKDFDRSRIDLI